MHGFSLNKEKLCLLLLQFKVKDKTNSNSPLVGLYSCRVLSQLSCLLYALGVDSNHVTREPCSSFVLVYDKSLRQCVLADVISMLPGENLLFHQLHSLMLYLGVLYLFPTNDYPFTTLYPISLSTFGFL